METLKALKARASPKSHSKSVGYELLFGEARVFRTIEHLCLQFTVPFKNLAKAQTIVSALINGRVSKTQRGTEPARNLGDAPPDVVE